MFDLTGKTAVVTGSGRGIGWAVAKKLHGLGANVVINDIASSCYADDAAQSLGGRAVCIKGDVRSAADVDALIGGAKEAFGSVDILVNNAGITRDGLLLRMDEAAWDDVLNINLKGAFLCTKAAVKVMAKQRFGRIVNLSSVVGIMGNAGQVNYASSKAGLIGMTKSVAKEFASRNVTVNAVAPGFIKSDMTDKLPDGVKEDYLKGIPLGRFGEADDIADAVAFLVSDAAKYITGQVLHIDGGLLM